MKTSKTLCSLAIASAILAMGAGSAQARDLTVVNFGGANGDAQNVAFIKPLEKKLGKKIIVVAYNGEQAKVKAMVDTHNVVWDAVEVETGDLGRGCDEGLYEKLNWDHIGKKSDFIPAAVRECGIGAFVWSTVLAYNGKTMKTAPKSWADFWDVKKFPGKRGMRKGARYNLEFALMADGVAPQDVYKVLGTSDGVNRAFKKLTELKPYIQWWEAGAQPPQMLAAGDVVMSTAYNGRISAANKDDHQSLKTVWNQNIYDLDYWVIPTGSPNKALAEQYIKYVTSSGPQAAYSEQIAYGPVNKSAIKKLSPKILAELPNSPENGKNALLSSYNFWADHGEELEQRFTAWATE
jgi:putative spermidine/putrescine transport system substrate-binding protein